MMAIDYRASKTLDQLARHRHTATVHNLESRRAMDAIAQRVDEVRSFETAREDAYKVEAERRESLGLLTAPDADAVREAPDASARLLRVAAAFHPGSREPPPSNPFRGEDADADEDAAPAPAPPGRVLREKRRGRRALRAR